MSGPTFELVNETIFKKISLLFVNKSGTNLRPCKIIRGPCIC